MSAPSSRTKSKLLQAHIPHGPWEARLEARCKRSEGPSRGEAFDGSCFLGPMNRKGAGHSSRLWLE
jgi:hypothetical protein